MQEQVIIPPDECRDVARKLLRLHNMANALAHGVERLPQEESDRYIGIINRDFGQMYKKHEVEGTDFDKVQNLVKTFQEATELPVRKIQADSLSEFLLDALITNTCDCMQPHMGRDKSGKSALSKG